MWLFLPVSKQSFHHSNLAVVYDSQEKYVPSENKLRSSYLRIHFSCVFQKIVFIHEKDDLSEDFTSKRIQLLSEVAKNLSSFVGFEVFDHDCDEFVKKIYFTHKSNFIKNNDHGRTVLCGVVQDFQTKVKASTVTVSEYKM